MTIEKESPCKVNLLLNILGKRPDGFHELETVMHPVNLCDQLALSRSGSGVRLTCSDPTLPADSTNLVYRAATAFLEQARISDGVRIHLEKKIPVAAGLGGGSANAATTLVGLNEIFGSALKPAQLQSLAASIGSDVPFFLQPTPALATGRGEKVQSLDAFAAMEGAFFLLVRPGFGIPTAWAYQQLARFPAALNGKSGRAESLIRSLQGGDLAVASREFYNSLEAPAFYKFPILALLQSFLREHGALAALMSGSGSTTFAIVRDLSTGRTLEQKLRQEFGALWTAIVPVSDKAGAKL
jgi:4-diphosphocytidyl-2-C-methyl-D-erythritol kinase